MKLEQKRKEKKVTPKGGFEPTTTLFTHNLSFKTFCIIFSRNKANFTQGRPDWGSHVLAALTYLTVKIQNQPFQFHVILENAFHIAFP